ncbi:MAG TPA: aminotransferase class IV [Bacteroidales bacterium]|nr:aminotransferase class IV [Bacteroidales bacterium]
MSECFGNYFIHNGTLQPVELFDNSFIYEGESIYEVLRMIRGLPVFFEDHFKRLETSTRHQKKLMLANREQLRKDILKLAEAEKIKDVNLKIVFNYNGVIGNYLVYFIEPVYPTAEQYTKGVKGVLFYAERKDPESKVINHKLRSEIYHKLIICGAYEALLVNRENCITEGSRSNIFFIKNNVLYTAPDRYVLGGITRKHIIEICGENDINVEFVCVNADKIKEYDSVFMTGTSPVVLPFRTIENFSFNVKHPYIGFLRNLLLERMEKSLRYFENISDRGT